MAAILPVAIQPSEEEELDCSNQQKGLAAYTEYTWFCSKHFVGGKKNDDPASPAYIPTLFHHVKSPAKRKAMLQLDRYERTKISKKRRLEAQLQEAEGATVTQEIDGIGMNDVGTSVNDDEDVENHSEQDSPMPLQPKQYQSSVMTNITAESIDCLERDCAALREEKFEFKKKINQKTPETFLDNEGKVCYSTGLPLIITLKAIIIF